jgi:hypothetical protein
LATEIDHEAVPAFFKVSTLMIRELRYLEAEFAESEEDEERSEELGIGLRSLGRRLVELCEEYLPRMAAEVAKETTSAASSEAKGASKDVKGALKEVKGASKEFKGTTVSGKRGVKAG